MLQGPRLGGLLGGRDCCWLFCPLRQSPSITGHHSVAPWRGPILVWGFRFLAPGSQPCGSVVRSPLEALSQALRGLFIHLSPAGIITTHPTFIVHLSAPYTSRHDGSLRLGLPFPEHWEGGARKRRPVHGCTHTDLGTQFPHVNNGQQQPVTMEPSGSQVPGCALIKAAVISPSWSGLGQPESQ